MASAIAGGWGGVDAGGGVGGGAGLRVRPAEVWRALWRAKSGSVSIARRASRKRRVSGLGSSARVSVAAGVREFGRANQRAGTGKEMHRANAASRHRRPFVDRKKAAQVEEWLSCSLGRRTCWS